MYKIDFANTVLTAGAFMRNFIVIVVLGLIFYVETYAIKINYIGKQIR